MNAPNRYSKLLAHVFSRYYQPGAKEVLFTREALAEAANAERVKLPKNLGDVIYSYRYRVSLPEAIAKLAPEGENWVILPAGIAKYRFVATPLASIAPNRGLAEIRIPNSTPGIIDLYALTDEQALLAKLRYNRIVDLFTGLTCYPLQSHLRTSVKELGQVETDEVYVGMSKSGAHYVVPVQAKRGSDMLSIVQIWQDWKMSEEKFPNLICRPLAAQFMADETIAVIEFEPSDALLKIRSEKHYKLVDQKSLTGEELRRYQEASEC